MAGIAAVAASAGCTYGGSTYPGAVGPVMTGPNTADEQPALNGVRAFDLGPVVVDGAGYVLYRYDKDSAQPPKSACDATCAQVWKPVPADATRNVRGIDPTLIGTLTRSDGTDQATIAGWPLYRYTKDEMAGQTDGLGMGGAWFPATPQGGKAVAVANPGQSNVFGL